MDISAETISDLRNILGFTETTEVPAGLIELYKKFSARKSRCGANGVVTAEEMITLAAIYETNTAGLDLPKESEIVKKMNESEIKPTGGDFVDQIKEGDEVVCEVNGEKKIGKVININNDHVRVEVNGDNLKFRKFEMGDLELKKE